MTSLFFYKSTKYIETFVIPLVKLRKAPQENLRALHTEEEFNGLFDLKKCFQSQKQRKVTWCKIRTVWWMVYGVGAPNQELQYGFALPSQNHRQNVRSEKPGPLFPNRLFQFRQGVTVPRSM
ncbi:hypothetical protein TNCV_2847061 [Trichonephila clavipes]|nr:hypothetical protein TNCV_2847061 [Trichonephila clavipes]